MNKIGILGGTFDPVHKGHVLIAEYVKEEFGLDEILFIPAGNSPHKTNALITDASHRLKMVELAIEGKEGLKASSMEIDDPEVSYTYRTMEKLSKDYDRNHLFFIMGGDSIAYFDKWVHPELISKYASLIVAARDAVEKDLLNAYVKQVRNDYEALVYTTHCSRIDVSSTELRGMLREGKDTSEYLHKDVIAYIKEQHLYE